MTAVDDPKVLLITANVGSIFEDPDGVLKLWLAEFLTTISKEEPALFALHCQEVGGKNYEESMQNVNDFVKDLLSAPELQTYDRARIYLDEDFTAVDRFTALGNLYFVHSSVRDVQLWNFEERRFTEVDNRDISSGNIDKVPTKEKAKFPKHFFPEFNWSRKGYLRTRWRLRGVTFDLVNIHLFHDASNFVSYEKDPSAYTGNRLQALNHTLDKFESDELENVPMYIFGDFNFRLDSHNLIERLTEGCSRTEEREEGGKVRSLEWRREDQVVLSLQKKGFTHAQHEQLFLNQTWLRDYDKEPLEFKSRLCEEAVTFPPSYPFSEEAEDGMVYMRTRCPSWCDRILYTPASRDIMMDGPDSPTTYASIGPSTCMGDHKPIYLSFALRGCAPVIASPSNGMESESETLGTGNTGISLSSAPNDEHAENVVASPPVSSSSTLTPLPPQLCEDGDSVFSDTACTAGPVATHRTSVNGSLLSESRDMDIHTGAEFAVPAALPEAIFTAIADGNPAEGGERTNSFKEAVRKIQRTSSVIRQWKRIRHHSSSSEDEPLQDIVSRSVARRRQMEEHQQQSPGNSEPAGDTSGERGSNKAHEEIASTFVQRVIEGARAQVEGDGGPPAQKRQGQGRKPNPVFYSAAKQGWCPCCVL